MPVQKICTEYIVWIYRIYSLDIFCRSVTLILFSLLSSYCPAFLSIPHMPADASFSLVQFSFQPYCQHQSAEDLGHHPHLLAG